jgi:hypothetical protein
LLRVERGEDITEVIARARTVKERPKTMEKITLHATEAGDIDTGFGPHQHRHEQHLVKRIHHFARLARVRRTIEMVEKNGGSRRARHGPSLHRP